MPILEFEEGRSLSQRFSFLDMDSPETGQDKDKGTTEHNGSAQIQATLRPSVLTDTKTPNNELLLRSYTSDDMSAIGVIKTTTGTQKLFINVTFPHLHKFPTDMQPHARFLFSLIQEDVDKSGVHCLVLTVLDIKAQLDLEDDRGVVAVLDFVRSTTGLEVGDKYSLPRMKKKGKLGDVLVPRQGIHDAPITSSATANSGIISEYEQTSIRTPYLPVVSGSSKVHALTPQVLSMPLPTRYTHYFQAMLSDAKSSWSVYYDSQDSTLKILLPPKEDFTTIAVSTQDFRAFTKDGHLHIFFIRDSS